MKNLNKKRKYQTKKQKSMEKLIVAFFIVVGMISIAFFTYMGLASAYNWIFYTNEHEVAEVVIPNKAKEIIDNASIDITQAYITKGRPWTEAELATRIKTETRIRELADKYDFKWTDYLVKLADCESSLGIHKNNKKGNKPSHSIDRGTFMYNSHWQDKVTDACAYDLDCATITTITYINNGKQHLWVCDLQAKGE